MPRIAYDYECVPTIGDFSNSDAFVRGLIGPFGSGKSSGCVVEFPYRAQNQRPGPDGIRRTRWAVVRNTMRELEDTTISTFHAWLPPAYFGRWYSTDHRYVIKAFENTEFEILFRGLDRPEHVKKLLSLDLTGAWVNEAREVPWPIIEALMGRCGRYPPMKDGGPTWSGLWMDTNPPDTDSKWYEFFEEKSWLKDFEALKAIGQLPPGVVRPEDYAAIFHQPSGLSPRAENLPNLTPGYYSRLGIGKSQLWKKVYIDGDYGFVSDDKVVYPEYRDENHLREVDPIPGITIERQWDFGLCYSSDTEVLTLAGWKFFKDVDEKADLAATRNPETGEFEYTPINFKIARPYKGKMLEWNNTELSLCVTPEHRVPFTHRDTPKKVRWATAQWLADHMTGHHYVDLVSQWKGRAAPDRIHGMEPMVFCEFMGLYLSEGSASARQVAIYQKDKKQEMQRILDATGLKWTWFKYGKTSGWRHGNADFARYLKGFGTSRHKSVPDEIKMLPPQHIRAFVMAYTIGDGHVRTRKNGAVEHTLFTTSNRMASDFQELAQKAGWNSSVRISSPQASTIIETKGPRVIQNGGGFTITFKKTATRAELIKRNFSEIDYDGMIYCLNVPHHTLYVRRKGKPSWNGNTPCVTFGQTLPSGQWIVFDELMATGMGMDRFSDEVLEHCGRSFRGRQVDYDDVGDPAGDQRAQTDEKTCFDIMDAKGIKIYGGEVSERLRMEAMRKPLTRFASNGEPAFAIHPRCKQTRKALLGGYHYRKMVGTANKYTTDPEKNHPYSDLANTLEYRASVKYGSGLTSGTQPDDFPQAARSQEGRSKITGY